MNKINQKGQFFSPDVLIALGIFVFSMALFWAASNFIFAQTDVVSERSNSGEVLHTVFDSLLLSSGYPINWEEKELEEIKVIGLVHSNNFVDEKKLITLIELLNSNDYVLVKQLLGAREYDLELSLIDFQEKIVNYEGEDLRGGMVLGSLTKTNAVRLVRFSEKEYLLKIILTKKD